MKQEQKKQETDNKVRLIISFFLGVTVTAVFLQVGLDSIAKNINSILIGFGILVIVFVIAAFLINYNKDRVLKALFGVSSSDMESTQKSFDDMVDSIVEGEYKQAATNFKGSISKISAWFTWINYRRWVILVFQGLLIGLGGLLGTVLLYNQNLLLLQQNDLLSQQNERFDIQNDLLENQNQLAEKQNDRLQQQNYLQEAQRRSSLVFLLGDIMQAIDDEIKSDYKNDGKRNISDELIGRIIALSQNMKPYKFLNTEPTFLNKEPKISYREVSAERGHLLISLLESNLDSNSYRKIFKKSNFSYADLTGIKLEDEYLVGINLKEAITDELELTNVNLSRSNLSDTWLHQVRFENVDFTGANLEGTSFNLSTIKKCRFNRAYCQEASFDGVIIEDTEFIESYLKWTIFDQAKIFNTNFSYATLFKASLFSSDSLRNIDLNNTKISSPEWISKDDIAKRQKWVDNPKTFEEIISKYLIQKNAIYKDNNWGTTDTMYILKLK